MAASYHLANCIYNGSFGVTLAFCPQIYFKDGMS